MYLRSYYCINVYSILGIEILLWKYVNKNLYILCVSFSIMLFTLNVREVRGKWSGNCFTLHTNSSHSKHIHNGWVKANFKQKNTQPQLPSNGRMWSTLQTTRPWENFRQWLGEGSLTQKPTPHQTPRQWSGWRYPFHITSPQTKLPGNGRVKVYWTQ